VIAEALRARNVHTGTAPKKAITSVLVALIFLSSAPVIINSSVYGRSLDSSPSRFEGNSPALGVFDGDSDGLRLPSSGFPQIIDIRFASLRISRFTFINENHDHGRLFFRDIDADGDLDLVWIGGGEQRTAVVLINDGRGDFTEAKDNAPYAAELDALLNGSDPSEQPSFQTEKQTYTLTSSPASDIAPAVASRLACPTVSIAAADGLEAFDDQSTFLSDLRKRGPPLIFS
jgi:hypothetical protein